jgi:hypothetical protein
MLPGNKGKYMENKRRFSRIACDDKIIVKFKENLLEASLLETSLQGALVAFKEEVSIQIGDAFQLVLTLKDSDDIVQFKSEVIYKLNNYLGVKFLLLDIESFGHISRYLEARSDDPQQIRNEYNQMVQSM